MIDKLNCVQNRKSAQRTDSLKHNLDSKEMHVIFPH